MNVLQKKIQNLLLLKSKLQRMEPQHLSYLVLAFAMNVFLLYALNYTFDLYCDIDQIVSTWFNEIFVFNAWLIIFNLELLSFYIFIYLWQTSVLYERNYDALNEMFSIVFLCLPLCLLLWHVSTHLEQRDPILMEFFSFFNISPIKLRMSESEAFIFFLEVKDVFIKGKLNWDPKFYYKIKEFLAIIDQPDFFNNCFALECCEMDFKRLVQIELERTWRKIIYVPSPEIDISFYEFWYQHGSYSIIAQLFRSIFRKIFRLSIWRIESKN